MKRVQEKAASAWNYLYHASNDHYAITIRPEFAKRKQPNLPSDANLIPSLRQQMVDAANECGELEQRLRAVDPLVIDYFIGQNRHLEDIAKLCIAWEILECETSEDWGPNDNWCRFLIHKLVSGCLDGPALLDNNVNFITFNYDLSLERRLWSGLSALRQFEDVAAQFLNGRIIRVYGKIRESETEVAKRKKWELNTIRATLGISPEGWQDGKEILDYAFAASKGIRTIAPKKAVAGPSIEKARRLISEAECVYILGYGFDDTNNQLLDLPNLLKASNKSKRVMFTNFENRGVVNKNASRMFFHDNPNFLLADGGQVVERRRPFICEKSIKKVYGALAYDFDAPEERPGSGS